MHHKKHCNKYKMRVKAQPHFHKYEFIRWNSFKIQIHTVKLIWNKLFHSNNYGKISILCFLPTNIFILLLKLNFKDSYEDKIYSKQKKREGNFYENFEHSSKTLEKSDCFTRKLLVYFQFYNFGGKQKR